MIDYSMLRYWLLFFHTRHLRFYKKKDLVAAHVLRLIDCETRGIQEAAPSSTYAALSYVWGRPTAGHLGILHNAIFLKTLLATIEDPIAVTKALEFRYL